MKLTVDHIDALKELINIGVGRAAGVLNQMVHSHILLRVPAVEVLTLRELRRNMAGLGAEPVAAVRLSFDGDFSGEAELVFPPDSASRLVSLLTNESMGTPDLDAVRAVKRHLGCLGKTGKSLGCDRMF